MSEESKFKVGDVVETAYAPGIARTVTQVILDYGRYSHAYYIDHHGPYLECDVHPWNQRAGG